MTVGEEISTKRLSVAQYEEYMQVKELKIQGKGPFTKVCIQQGVVLRNIEGKRQTYEYHPALSDKNPNWFGIGYEEWIELCPRDISVFINHSCCPNTIVNENLELVTIKAISENEEILLDYSTTELDPTWKMSCCCSSNACRFTIKSFQFLPYQLQREYGKYLNPVFMKFASIPLAHHV